MKLATELESSHYFSLAKKYYDEIYIPNIHRWDAGNPTVFLAEYLANQDGITLYSSNRSLEK